MPAFDRSMLRAARERRGLTREQVALLTGKTYSAIAKIENGINAPSSGTLGRLAGALGCTVADFFDPECDEPGEPREAELRRIVAGLPPLDSDQLHRLSVLLARQTV